MIESVPILAYTLLAGGLLYAAWTDIDRHRIANWLVLALLAGAVGLRVVFGQSGALLEGLAATAVGLCGLLPFYLLRGMGAGDVKLMAAVGAWFTPQVAAVAVASTLLAGMAIALLLVLWQVVRVPWLRYALTLEMNTATRGAGVASLRKLKFPYAIAIALGTACALLLAIGGRLPPSWLQGL